MENLWIWLVVGFNPSENYEFVNWDAYSQLNGKRTTVPNHQPDWDLTNFYHLPWRLPYINGHATGADSLEVPTMYFCSNFQVYGSRDIPSKYGLKYGTNVPSF